MKKHKKSLFFIFVILLCSIHTYAQVKNLSSENTNKYIMSANVSFERSGAESYEPPEDFQFVNNFGISISRRISKQFWIGINPQLIKNKSTLGVDRPYGYYVYSFVSENVRIPLNLLWYKNSFYLRAGPYCDILLNVPLVSNFEFEEYFKIDSFGYGMGAAAGMENRLYKTLFLFAELRFNHNINLDLHKRNNSSFEGRFANYGFNIGLNIHL